jgi:hypothetical protein
MVGATNLFILFLGIRKAWQVAASRGSTSKAHSERLLKNLSPVLHFVLRRYVQLAFTA